MLLLLYMLTDWNNVGCARSNMYYYQISPLSKKLIDLGFFIHGLCLFIFWLFSAY